MAISQPVECDIAHCESNAILITLALSVIPRVGEEIDLDTAGVQFVRPPAEQDYGTVAVFVDLYGTKWDLVQFGAVPPPPALLVAASEAGSTATGATVMRGSDPQLSFGVRPISEHARGGS